MWKGLEESNGSRDRVKGTTTQSRANAEYREESVKYRHFDCQKTKMFHQEVQMIHKYRAGASN